jgi:hypothetical protein
MGKKSNRKFSVLGTGVHLLSLAVNLPASGRLAINSGVRWLGEVPDRYENSANPGAHTASSRLVNCTKIRTDHLIAGNFDHFRVPKQQFLLGNHIKELFASFRLLRSRNWITLFAKHRNRIIFYLNPVQPIIPMFYNGCKMLRKKLCMINLLHHQEISFSCYGCTEQFCWFYLTGLI